MNTEPTDPTIRDVLGFHEALRRLHVPAARIFVVPREGEGVVGIAATPVVGEPVGFAVGDWPTVAGKRLTLSELDAAWRGAVEWWNNAEGAEASAARERLWRAFAVKLDAVRLSVIVSSRVWGA